MNPRTFNPSAFETSDSLAKDAAVRLFCSHPSYRAVWAEDYYRGTETQYKADLVVVDRKTLEHVYSLEVEVKSTWKSNSSFPYSDIQFVPRKMEKWTDPKFTFGKPMHWILFNEDASRHLVVFDSVIRGINGTRWVNCQVRGMEKLFFIDKSQAHFDYL